MMRVLFVALLFDLSVVALGSKCLAGRTLLTDLKGLNCKTSATDTASCDAACCTPDKKKCGSMSGFVPATDYYCGPAGTSEVAKDAWKNLPATEATKNTACCAPKATCGGGGYTVPAGKKLKSSEALTKCDGGPETCAAKAQCFELDNTKCGGITGTNTVDQAKCNGWFPGPATYVAATDAWKNAPAGNDPANAKSCCAPKAVCGSTFYSCKPGFKKAGTDATWKAQRCTTDAASCADTAACCVADANTCGNGGTYPVCGASSYFPSDKEFWLKKPTTPATKTADCCLQKATCKLAVCSAGYKLKANVENLSCPSDAASCAETTANCCEKDVTKCGGQDGISCVAGFYDESVVFNLPGSKTTKAVKNAWKNKPATALTKNTACCTPVAPCAAATAVVTGGTTTPAAVVTSTPAAVVTSTPVAPALKFSAHGHVKQEGSSNSNLVSFGAGCFIGMGVLMGVLGLRSRFATRADSALE